MAKNLALYVHYPFCKSKCPYCDFNSHVRDSYPNDAMLIAYKNELDYWYNKLASSNTTITSIFLGGGTPSLMPPTLVEGIVQYASAKFSLAKNCEITLEANPTSSDAIKFKDFKLAGVNRLSIGVQSLDSANLKFLGREHSSAEALKTVELAASIYNNFSFDVIYALPKQTLQSWHAELKEVLSYGAKHLSLYQLVIEQGTKFWHMQEQGKFTMPSDDIQADFYELTNDMCNKAGLPAYEISNHAANGYESKHNMAYWQYKQYMGIGAGAHGRVNIDGQLYSSLNYRSPEKWLQNIQDNGNALEKLQVLSSQQQLEERLIMGMRLKEGIEVKKIGSKILAMQKQNLVDVKDKRVKATSHGTLLLHSVIENILIDQ